MSYNVPNDLLAMLQSGALPSEIKVVSKSPAGGTGSGEAENGTWANPYRTIGAAVAAMTPVDGADQSTWAEQLWIMSGEYDEDVEFTKSKIMLIYTVGAVRIGTPLVPQSVTWNKDAPTQITGAPPGTFVPAIMMLLPMPQVADSEITLFEINGDFIVTGDPETRFCWFQNTNVQDRIMGEDTGQPTEWTGSFDMALVQSKAETVQFGLTVTYEWTFQKSAVGAGIFVGGNELAGGSIVFDNASVDSGSFTPNGLPMETAAVWAPEANEMIALTGSEFDGDVEARVVAFRDSQFGVGSTVTVRDSDLQDCVFGGGFISTNDADKMRRCEFVGNVDVADITLIEDCIFQANFENDTGNPDVRGCLFEGGTDFGSVGMVSNCRFNDTLDATSAEAYFLGCRVTGAINFTDPTKFYVDIASNSMTHIAGSAFPATTNLLNDTTIP